MTTYERVFGSLGKVIPYGHAYANSVNKSSLYKAKIEIEKILKVRK